MNTIGLKFILAERFTFDPNSNTLIDEQSPNDVQHLGSNESRILQYFALHPNQIVRRNELHDYVWRKHGFEVDDSSLTQAVSTLRKNLDDSIKSPLFIRTIPKQGYQWIAEVESSSVEKLIAHNNKLDVDALNGVIVPSLDVESLEPEIKSVENTSEIRTVESTAQMSRRQFWLIKLLFGLALLIPIVTIFVLNPTLVYMEPIITVDGVEVAIPPSHPDISNWTPAIERCVEEYNQSHSDQPKPDRVLATGGQENKLVLNFIYPAKNIDLSTTLVLFINQSELGVICQ